MREKTPDYLQKYSMDETETEDYLRHVEELRETYRDRIRIKVGFELEFFLEGMEHTLALIESHRPRIEDCLISLHFLPARGIQRMTDYSPDDVRKHLLPVYGSVEAIHEAYWDGVERMIATDFGGINPRIGHLGLIYKFIHVLPIDEAFRGKIRNRLRKSVFPALRKHARVLDFNVRGFGQRFCRRCYLDEDMLTLAGEFGVPVVYGSDSHCPEDVGKYYEFYASRAASFRLVEP